MARLAGPSSVEGFHFGFPGCTRNLTPLASKPLHMLSSKCFEVVHWHLKEIRDEVNYFYTIHDTDLERH